MPAILKPSLGGGGGGGGGDFLPLAGGTMTGAITLAGDAIAPLNPVTLEQLQAAQFGFLAHAPVAAATAEAIVGTYNNGASGVGATLSTTATGVVTINGYSPELNDRILIQTQVAPAENGIYTITTLGIIGVAQVYTRSTDFDSVGPEGVATGAYVIVENGDTYNDNTIWMTSQGPFTIGTTALNWSVLTIPTSLTFIGNLSQSGNNVNFANPFTEDANFGAFFARFNNAAGLKDANGNPVLTVSAVASSVNHIRATNAATGTSPLLSVISASGTAPDLNVLTPSGVVNLISSGSFSGALVLTDVSHTSGVRISAPVSVVSYQILFPAAQGAGSFVNDGSGNGSWVPSLELAGGTMTGPIILSGNAVNPLEPTTLQQVSTFGATLLPKSGGTMTGPLILATDPIDPLEAATKQYVDAEIGAGFTPLSSQTASNSAFLTFTTGFSSAYTRYEVILQNMVAAVNSNDYYMQVTADGGSTWTAVTFTYNAITASGSTPSGTGGTAADQIALSGTASVSNTQPLSGVINLFGVGSAVTASITSQVTFYGSGTASCCQALVTGFTSATTINGIRVYFGNGNTASGKVTIFGYLA